MVAEAHKDLKRTYGGGWGLLSTTAQKALVLQRRVEFLCIRETPRSGQIACDEMNVIRRLIDDMENGGAL